jgi:polar amino acid transport system permease protein
MWSWEAFFHYLTSLSLLEGAVTTVWLTAVTMVLGLILGLLLALMHGSANRPLKSIAASYIWLFRGTPLLVQLIIIYTGLPQVGIRMSPIWCAVIGLSLNEAAYHSEIVRSGLLGVPKGQYEAARALGMTPPTAMRFVVMPQALRIMVPPLGNSLNGLLKTTTLVSVISVEELLRRTQYAVQIDYRVLEGLVAAALFYLLMTSAWAVIQAIIERRLSRSHAAIANAGPKPETVDVGEMR